MFFFLIFVLVLYQKICRYTNKKRVRYFYLFVRNMQKLFLSKRFNYIIIIIIMKKEKKNVYRILSRLIWQTSETGLKSTNSDKRTNHIFILWLLFGICREVSNRHFMKPFVISVILFSFCVRTIFYCRNKTKHERLYTIMSLYKINII